MNRKISLGAAIAFILIVAAATFSATMTYAQTYFNQKAADVERSRDMYVKFTEVDRAARENYSGTINELQLMDSVAQGYIKGLGDKYATYISAEEYKRLMLSREGEDVGIGAVVEVSPDGYLTVLEVYPDSPAQVAGIEAGDDIIKIGEINLTPENIGQAAGMLQGDAGTKISLVVRQGAEDVKIPELTRRAVAVPSVYSRMIPETNVGYILIKQFNANTSDQFNRELNKIIEAGASSLVFDVRDNKGLSTSSAVRVIDKLVPAGTIYSAEYKDGRIEEISVSDANEIDLPMVVLVNGATSSSAELFAQDLKDFGKASIVGQTTFGKGVLLNRINLSDGSAIELTVATLLTKSGETFNDVGVKPDYDIMPEGDWTQEDENTDPQLKKAVELALAMRKAEVTAQVEAGIEVSEPEPAKPAPQTSSSSEESGYEIPEEDDDSGDESSDEENPDEESSGEESEDGESSEDDGYDKDDES